jgi:Leucine-rich repeat (LRR) protein
LYGLDDLIDTLPESLTDLQIQNRDNSNVIIRIPESISRFKNLNLLLLENCIDAIPDSICELTNLKFLSLVNNQKLTKIPECVVNLPNIFFINLKGSTSVEIPNIMKEKGTNMGGGLWDVSSN